LDTLVQLAIYGSPTGRLTLQEIYAAIKARFDWYKKSDSSWRASIRHMLSLKSVFKSTERPPTAPGRGSYWQLD
ncbi:fork head domain-containing protein, partial [Lentinula raphanica]